MHNITEDQFQGCLLGLAIGDALGSPWEGLSADLICSAGPAEEIVSHDSEETLYYTDDTQMTVGVVQTLLEYGAIDIDALARNFANNYHPDRGYGQGARKIINAIGFNEDWQSVARDLFEGKGSWGNGAAMRVAPLGLFFSSNQQKLIHEAAQSAKPTHQHVIGIDGARLIAVATSLAGISADQLFSRTDFLEQLRSVAQTEEFQWQLDHALKLKPYDSIGSFGNSLEAHKSVVTSIICFADAPDSYTDVISRAVAQGNDVDTLAAMAGALSGARLGISAIPQNLIDCLENKHQGRDFLINIASLLFKAYSN